MSEREAEDVEELLLPIKEAAVGDAIVPPDDVPDDWLDQQGFDPAGRPI
jgi:hypothetical protein